MQKTLCLFSAGQHTRLFPEPDPGVEVSLSHSSGQTYRTFLQSTLPGQYTVCIYTCPFVTANEN